MAKISDEELLQLIEDSDYWQSVAAVAGVKVLGWTYKNKATFYEGDQALEIPGWFAERILSLGQRAETAPGSIVGKEATTTAQAFEKLLDSPKMAEETDVVHGRIEIRMPPQQIPKQRPTNEIGTKATGDLIDGKEVAFIAPATTRVWVQKWEESERGWGVRPDGFTMHRTREQLKAFIKRHWDSLPAFTPDEYSRQQGKEYEAEVVLTSEQIAILNEKGVVWGNGNNYPAKI